MIRQAIEDAVAAVRLEESETQDSRATADRLAILRAQMADRLTWIGGRRQRLERLLAGEPASVVYGRRSDGE